VLSRVLLVDVRRVERVGSTAARTGAGACLGNVVCVAMQDTLATSDSTAAGGARCGLAGAPARPERDVPHTLAVRPSGLGVRKLQSLIPPTGDQ
jgi:hypothetical protein